MDCLNKDTVSSLIQKEISGIDKVMISRTGYTGELGFELYVLNEQVESLWNSLFNTTMDYNQRV